MRATCQEALAQDYPGIRIVGEMDWCTRALPGAQRILDYELRLDAEVFASLPLTGLCLFQYPSPSDTLPALAVGAHLQHLTTAGDIGQPASVLPLAVTPAPGGARLHGHADFDTRASLCAVLDALPSLREHTVHLDLSGTDFADADALARLSATATTLHLLGRGLVVHNPPPSQLRIAQLFPHEGSVLEMTA